MIITNLSNTELIFISREEVPYNLPAAGTISIPDDDIPFDQLSLLISKGIVAVSGWNVGVTHSYSIITDSTGQYYFNVDSLPSTPTYDINGALVALTYGPDVNGRSIRQTSTWTNGVWMGDSAWVLV